MSWTKLPAIEGRIACLTCGCGAHDQFDMESIIAVGFGSAGVTKDGIGVWDEQEAKNEQYWQGKDAEAEAAKDPDHDWRIYMNAPLYEAEYQRHGANHWVLVKKGDGFA